MKCYNCSIDLNSTNKTVEHIPAKNTFNGYSDEFKKNRITVPACHTCNNIYSKTDQEIRDAVGIMNDKNDSQNELTRQAVKSILRRKDWIERVDKFNPISVTFDYNEFKKLHIKNFKGIFYHKYGYPFPENIFNIETIAEGDEKDSKRMNFGKYLFSYLDDGSSWCVSGHEDIFQYKIKFMTPDENKQMKDTPNIEIATSIVAILVYHKKLSPIIFATKNEFIKTVLS